ncbi:MAG: uroporphyrinogen decarboxylase family protein [Desulfotomaculaceae bacterium]|nr:uroporphyrinogen decarboxylase family protein [Desulfotomaculaceae bacterium]
MSLAIDFKCRGESPEEIPVSIMNSTGISFSKAHTDKFAMAVIAEQLKEYKGDCICRVPFCLTVEAEALGAKVIIPDEKAGPRFANYKFNSIEELVEIEEMDLLKGRINEVLNCVEALKKNGNTVALNVEGAFSILALLIDPVKLYKGIGKHRKLIEEALKVIENSVVKYIMAGIEKGAKLISYADPTGALEIVGPKIFREISGKASYNILKRVEGELAGAMVHLCGKTSTAFEKTGFCKVKPITVAGGLTYGEAICQLEQGEGVKFIGHGCMKSTPVSMRQPVLWQVELV